LGAELITLLICVGVWQVAFFVTLRGWPFAEIGPRWARLLAANAVVLGGGVATYLLLHDVAGWELGTISAACGSVIAAGLVAGLLFEGWAEGHFDEAGERAATLTGTALLALALYLLLTAYANGLEWTRTEPEDWVAYVGLNAIGLGVILHVAVGRRWPFGDQTATRADVAREDR
jgi:hypothetical protein